MRIRKRWDSSSAFGNTKTCPSTPTQPQPYDAADSHQQQTHLLPLLQTTGVELADCTGPRQRHKQPSNGVHKWKQALQLNSEAEDIHVEMNIIYAALAVLFRGCMSSFMKPWIAPAGISRVDFAQQVEALSMKTFRMLKLDQYKCSGSIAVLSRYMYIGSMKAIYYTEAYPHLPLSSVRAAEPEFQEIMEAACGDCRCFHTRMVMGEWSGDAVECKGISSSLRNQGENIGHASKQDKSVDTDEGSPENGIPSDHEEEWDVFKSSRFPKTSSSYTQQLVQLGEGSEYLRPVCSLPLKKRKRNMKESPSADDSHCGNGWRPDAKMFPVSIKRPKVIKADTGDEEWKDEVNSRKEMNKKNKTQTAGKMSEWSAGGSQCRRMNGRGWRCSQRTLVGYALCEHHLGKGRLKSINTTHHLHTTNASCKDLQLMPSNANLIESQDLGQEEKKKRLVKARSLKLISRNT
eukprot:Gb_11843 [translate_table: standard]